MEQPQFESMLGHLRDALSSYMRMRLLQSVPLLCRLPEPKLSQLSDLMTRQSFSDGEYIIREGSEGDCFYIISDGEVKCTKSVKSTEDGKVQEEELMRLSGMEYFGERALIRQEIRTASMVSLGATSVYVLDKVHFKLFLYEYEVELKSDIAKQEESLNADILSRASMKKYHLEELEIMRTVGTGTFGRVKLVQDKISNRAFALKCMNKRDIVVTDQQYNVLNEKELLLSCRGCPFIIELVQTFNDSDQIYVLMEFIQGGELWSYIYDESKVGLIPRGDLDGFEVETAKFYAANVILAFEYMHARNIAYRDLKPEVI